MERLLKTKLCPITFITFHNCWYYVNIVVNISTYTINAMPPDALILEPDTEISTNLSLKIFPAKYHLTLVRLVLYHLFFRFELCGQQFKRLNNI